MFELVIVCAVALCPQPFDTLKFKTLDQCQSVVDQQPTPSRYACKPRSFGTTGTTGKQLHQKLDLYTVTIKWEHTGTGIHTLTPITHFSKSACEQHGKNTAVIMAERKEVKSVTYKCEPLPSAL